MIQNLAYCALVEDQKQTPVPNGLVIYAGKQVRRVEYNEANRLWLHSVIDSFVCRALFRESRAIIKCVAVVPAAGCGNSATSLCRSPISGL
jgi:hypothetical protein